MPKLIPLPGSALHDRGWTAIEKESANVVLDAYRALIDGATSATMAKLYAENYRDHASTVPGGDLPALVDMVRGMADHFPETEIELLMITADDRLVTVLSRGRRRVDDAWDTVLEIFRLDGGRIAEHWEAIEPAGLFSAPPVEGEGQ